MTGAAPPEAGFVHAFAPSPNHDARADGVRPDILLLHYTGMDSADASLARLRDPAAKVSAHYLVDERGFCTQMVAEDRRAWHAGAGSWEGRSDVNSRSVGIEIQNGGHAGGLPPFPDEQIAAVIGLGLAIVDHWGIRPDRVLAHSDIAPDRKEDPGELFPWSRLAAAGLGVWVDPAPPDDVLLRFGDAGDEVATLQEGLAAFGYGIARTGLYDPATAAVIRAFQRRFRPARIDGLADGSTLGSLRRLVAMRPD